MASIKIVTDSTADLSSDLLAQYDISMIPLQVNFSSESLKDRLEITPAEFYQRLKTEKKVPRTSQPAPGDIYNVYKKLADEGHSIVSIHIASNFSGTYQAALLAKSMLPEADIHVFDSRTVSVGLGLVVLAAAKAVKEGKSLEEVISVVERTIPNIKIYFFVDTLEYLAKGGRIGGAAAFLGSLLNIKPLLAALEGEVQPVEKVRGRKRAVSRLIKIIKSETAGKKCHCILAHAGNKPGLDDLAEKIRPEINFEEILLEQLGPVVGCHVGPGAVGIAFYTSS
ncbi:DegV family protein with EDD domain [Desulfohalotomaculum tongense]|uniref:DegV family protein n=1 Tax=Desulforadius tongensis TaxID=1216062 RepID=UPI00195D09A2|nr:DegV family protein [Desulforadius tongensis]MBM7855909.1 DegV family protein with EDD domain [Desulforadius tongensis]